MEQKDIEKKPIESVPDSEAEQVAGGGVFDFLNNLLSKSKDTDTRIIREGNDGGTKI